VPVSYVGVSKLNILSGRRECEHVSSMPSWGYPLAQMLLCSDVMEFRDIAVHL